MNNNPNLLNILDMQVDTIHELMVRLIERVIRIEMHLGTVGAKLKGRTFDLLYFRLTCRHFNLMDKSPPGDDGNHRDGVDWLDTVNKWSITMAATIANWIGMFLECSWCVLVEVNKEIKNMGIKLFRKSVRPGNSEPIWCLRLASSPYGYVKGLFGPSNPGSSLISSAWNSGSVWTAIVDLRSRQFGGRT